MNIAELFYLGIALLFLLLVAYKLLASPLRITLKVLGNSILGLIALILFDLMNPFPSFHIAVTLWNALFVGVLGPYGFLLLPLLQWVLQT